MRSFSLGLLVVSIWLIQACGFHLRGSGEVADRYNPLFIEPGDLKSAQLNALTHALKQSKAELNVPKDGANRLKLSLIPLKPQKIASSTQADIEIVRLSVRADFTVLTPEQAVLIQDEMIHTRELQLDSANVLSHQSLIEQSYRELERSLIRSLIYRLKR